MIKVSEIIHAEHDLREKAERYMDAVTANIFNVNIFDLHECENCINQDECEERLEMLRMYHDFKESVKPQAEKTAEALARANLLRSELNKKGDEPDTGELSIHKM